MPEIVSFEGEFHGRTYGALWRRRRNWRATRRSGRTARLRSVPDNDVDALRAAVGPNTAAVLIEPIQGESGVWPTSDEALVAAREACDAVGALLIFDEIQTGIGQDRLALGLPADAGPPRRDHQRQGARRRACRSAPASPGRRRPRCCEPGDHGSTFAAGPIATSAALAVLDAVDDPALLRSVRELGTRLRNGLEALPGVAGTFGGGA